MDNIIHNVGSAATRFASKKLASRYAANATQRMAIVGGSASNASTCFAQRKLAARFVETRCIRSNLPIRPHFHTEIEGGVAEVPVSSPLPNQKIYTIAQIPVTVGARVGAQGRVGTRPKPAAPCSQPRNFNTSLFTPTARPPYTTPARIQSSYNLNHSLETISISPSCRASPTAGPTLAALVFVGIIVANKNNEPPGPHRSNLSAGLLRERMGNEEEEKEPRWKFFARENGQGNGVKGRDMYWLISGLV